METQFDSNRILTLSNQKKQGPMTLKKEILLFSSGEKANFEEKIKQDQQIGTQFLKKGP